MIITILPSSANFHAIAYNEMKGKRIGIHVLPQKN